MSRRAAEGTVVEMAAGEVLARLAAAVARLGPDRSDPERFHAEKSAIVAQLRRIARTLDAQRRLVASLTRRFRPTKMSRHGS